MTYHDAGKLILDHTVLALAAALFFAAGAACSLPVMRRKVRFLLVVPRWFSERLARILEARPSVAGLGLFIFCFNGVAIFIYMLTGLIPGVPILVTFLTGLNVALASMMGEGTFRAVEAATHRLSNLARVCAVLTFVLELPCFWFAMAMGMTLDVNVVSLLRGADPGSLVARIQAYVMILLPVLAVSAFAEAYAVTSAFRREE